MAVPATFILAAFTIAPLVTAPATGGGTDDFNSCTFGINLDNAVTHPFSCTFHCHDGNRISVFGNGPGVTVVAVCGGLTTSCTGPDALQPSQLLPEPRWLCENTSEFGATEDRGSCSFLGPVPPIRGGCQNFGL